MTLPSPSLHEPPAVNQKRVLVVDDHPVFRRGIAALISEQEQFVMEWEFKLP